MKLPQVGDILRFTQTSFPNHEYVMDKEYTVVMVEYPDSLLDDWFYLIGEDGHPHPFLPSEIGKCLEFVTPSSDSPLWSL